MNVGSDRVFTRFIPAGAGNTVLDHFKFTIDSVYPRWRGEHTDCGICSVQILGLSPLARGTLNHQPDHQLPHRFIPAGAGNTGITVIHWPPISVYPRWRGEHGRSQRLANGPPGLSPLARGTPRHQHDIAGCNRFIPAGAGNTEYSAGAQAEVAVYPRWRGEHTKHT